MRVYLDHNSTTPIDNRVVDAMLPYLTEQFGNPSSAHGFGASAARAVEASRVEVAELVGAEPRDVLFCSGATEAINTAISAVADGKVVTTVVEHAATLRSVERLEERGVDVVRLPVDSQGLIDVSRLAEELDARTSLVTLLWANNETGGLFPITEIASICAARSVPLHVDAVQAVGRISVDLRETQIDYLSISSHKIGGPKGVGALVVNPSSTLRPLIVGGHQERGARAGTENVAGIVGFGAAAHLARTDIARRQDSIRALRDQLETEILARIPGSWVNGQKGPRLANTTNIGFPGIDGDELVAMLDAAGIAVSTGSACGSASVEPSHVIRALTKSYEAAKSSVRFSLSHITSPTEISYTIEYVVRLAKEIQRTTHKSPNVSHL